MICWMKRHKPPTWSWQVAPSASLLSLWGNENPGAILIEGRVSVQSHKRSQVTRLITYRSQEWSNEPSAVLSHKGAGDKGASGMCACQVTPGILAWRTPQTEEPGGLESMGSQRAGHDWATNPTTTTVIMPRSVVKHHGKQRQNKKIGESLMTYTQEKCLWGNISECQ